MKRWEESQKDIMQCDIQESDRAFDVLNDVLMGDMDCFGEGFAP